MRFQAWSKGQRRTFILLGIAIGTAATVGIVPFMQNEKKVTADSSSEGLMDTLQDVVPDQSHGNSISSLNTLKNGLRPTPIPLPGPLRIKGTLKDTYKIQVTIQNTNQTYMLDMRSRKPIYDQAGYYQNGRLLKSANIVVHSYEELRPHDIDQDGVCELQGLQRIDGIAEGDTIAYVTSHWKWRYSQWTLMRAELITS
jgi:hypothetical protein